MVDPALVCDTAYQGREGMYLTYIKGYGASLLASTQIAGFKSQLDRALSWNHRLTL
jgi:hypothetical protein